MYWVRLRVAEVGGDGMEVVGGDEVGNTRRLKLEGGKKVKGASAAAENQGAPLRSRVCGPPSSAYDVGRP